MEGERLPHLPDIPIHILPDPWKINGTHLLFCISSLIGAKICAYRGPQWYMNNIIWHPKSECLVVTVKQQNLFLLLAFSVI